jgi:hypothetical protein
MKKFLYIISILTASNLFGMNQENQTPLEQASYIQRAVVIPEKQGGILKSQSSIQPLPQQLILGVRDKKKIKPFTTQVIGQKIHIDWGSNETVYVEKTHYSRPSDKKIGVFNFLCCLKKKRVAVENKPILG